MPYDLSRFPISNAVETYFNTKRDNEARLAQEEERKLRMNALNRHEAQAQREYDFNNSLANIGTEGVGLSAQMKARAQQARNYGLVDKADAYDALAKKARDEGVIGMSQSLISGDIEGALKSYNEAGDDRITAIKPFETTLPDGSKRVFDGERKYTVTYANGQEVAIDPHKILAIYGKEVKDPNAEYAKQQLDYALDVNKAAATEEIKRRYGNGNKERFMYMGPGLVFDKDTQRVISAGLSGYRSNGRSGDLGGLNEAQLKENARIEAARRRVHGLFTDDKRLIKKDEFGNDNPAYDEALAKDLEWARKLKHGYDPEGESYLSRPAVSANGNGNNSANGGLNNNAQPTIDWRAYEVNPKKANTAPTNAAKPTSRVDSIKTKEQILNEGPAGIKAKINGQISNSASDRANERAKMARGFGIKPDQTGALLGSQYNDFAMAVTRVNQAINSRNVPDKADLEKAFIFAQNATNPPVTVDEIAAIYNKFYAGK